MQVFDIQSKKGEKIFGYIDMLEYPHGTKERLPICLIEGIEEGPTFLLSGNIHGDELHGLVTLQELIQEINPSKVKGTIIIIPSLNPAGLLVMTRTPLYISKDPNRLWPDPKPKKKPELKYEDPFDANLDSENYPNVQEIFYTKFAEIFDKVDFYIDLHCHAIRSLPFSYLDRVYYDEKIEGQKEESQKLFDKTKEFVEAFGFTLVLEGPPKYYFKNNLQRSTTGSFVNKYRKPGFTVELGASGYVETDIVSSAKIGVFNALKHAGNLEGEIEKVTSFPVLDEKMWREVTIRTTHSGFFVPLIKAGKVVEKDTPIFEVRDIFGKVKETILAPGYGTILGMWDDIRCYPNQEIGVFIVDNTIPLVLPWEYEKKEEKKN